MQPNLREEPERLLTCAEVGALFRVDAKTAGRWGDEGRLPCIRTPGGQRRFRESVVRAALAGEQVTRDV